MSSLALTNESVLNKIAFEYYPLDLDTTSNPFLISWWPLALGDPALFHVSLQTASLDEELSAQNGFEASQILMAESIALLRRKVEVTSRAVQDGTMNSIITLAAIEVSLSLARMRLSYIKITTDILRPFSLAWVMSRLRICMLTD